MDEEVAGLLDRGKKEGKTDEWRETGMEDVVAGGWHVAHEVKLLTGRLLVRVSKCP